MKAGISRRARFDICRKRRIVHCLQDLGSSWLPPWLQISILKSQGTVKHCFSVTRPIYKRLNIIPSATCYVIVPFKILDYNKACGIARVIERQLHSQLMFLVVKASSFLAKTQNDQQSKERLFPDRKACKKLFLPDLDQYARDNGTRNGIETFLTHVWHIISCMLYTPWLRDL